MRRKPDYEPPEPDWKYMPVFRDALPETGPAAAHLED